MKRFLYFGGRFGSIDHKGPSRVSKLTDKTDQQYYLMLSCTSHTKIWYRYQYIISPVGRWISNVFPCQFAGRYHLQQESYEVGGSRTISNMYIQPFTKAVDWPEMLILMELSTMFYICKYCFFTWWESTVLQPEWWSIKNIYSGYYDYNHYLDNLGIPLQSLYGAL